MTTFYGRLLKPPVAALLLAGPLLAGCGGSSDQPELGIVRGSVIMDGKPLPNALVSFFPATGRASNGVTKEDGTYELSYLYDVPGAAVGLHKVTITTFVLEDDSPDARKTVEKIPKRYNTKTTLSADVAPDENVIDFTLTSK